MSWASDTHGSRVGILGIPALPKPGHQFFAGAAVAAVRWTEALLRAGVECEFFVNSDDQPYARDFAGTHYSGSFHVSCVSELRAQLSRHRYLAIHDPFNLNRLDAMARIVRRFSHRPVAVTAAHYALSFPDVHMATQRLSQLGDGDAVGIFCLSTASRDAQTAMFQRFGSWTPFLCVVPGLVDTNHWTPAPEQRGEVRRRQGLDPASHVLLCVGRLTDTDKVNWELITRTAKACEAHTHRRVQVVLAGADVRNFAATLSTLAARDGVRCVVKPNASGADMLDLYRAADVFVSPADSVQESFGLTVIEAGACGLPSVVTDWDGYKDLIVDGQTGFLVPTRWRDADPDSGWIGALGDLATMLRRARQAVSIDEQCFLRAVLSLLRDEGLRKRLGEAARRRVATEFGYEAVVSRSVDAWDVLHRRMDGAWPSQGEASAQEIDFSVFAHYASQATASDWA